MIEIHSRPPCEGSPVGSRLKWWRVGGPQILVELEAALSREGLGTPNPCPVTVSSRDFGSGLGSGLGLPPKV